MRGSLLLLVIIIPGLISPVFWAVAQNFRGRRVFLVSVFFAYLLVTLALPIAFGTMYFAYIGDKEQSMGLVVVVLLFRLLELFLVFSGGKARNLWSKKE